MSGMCGDIDATPCHQFELTEDAAARQVGSHRDAQVARTVRAAGGVQRLERSNDRSRRRRRILMGAVHLCAEAPAASLA